MLVWQASACPKTPNQELEKFQTNCLSRSILCSTLLPSAECFCVYYFFKCLVLLLFFSSASSCSPAACSHRSFQPFKWNEDRRKDSQQACSGEVFCGRQASTSSGREKLHRHLGAEYTTAALLILFGVFLSIDTRCQHPDGRAAPRLQPDDSSVYFLLLLLRLTCRHFLHESQSCNAKFRCVQLAGSKKKKKKQDVWNFGKHERR